MKEILRAKKVEVAHYYLLGFTYGGIEEKTGVSHGSIANIVQELENGKLDIPGTAFDQVDDLHTLSLDLKKKGLSTSQAMLGLLIFEKAHELKIVPDEFDQWAKLINMFKPPDFPASDFLEAALKLHELEKSGGETFETVVGEYENAKGRLENLKLETATQEKRKITLSKEIASISVQLQQLENARTKLETKVDVLADQAKELQLKVETSKLARTGLNKEIRELQQKRVKLSSQVDGKEESLARLNDIGFQDEDLLRIRGILERVSQDSGGSQKEVKQGFFKLLSTFKTITELETSRQVLMVALENLTKQESVLTGEIAVLENQKSVLQGEIRQSASSVVDDIKVTGENAVSELKQQTDNIGANINTLFAEALNLAATIDRMKTAIKTGEESGKGLSDFIIEMKNKAGLN